MSRLIVVIFLLSLVNCMRAGIVHFEGENTSEKCEKYCYSLDKERLQKYRFSSKTAYQFVKGRDTKFDLPGCKPVKFWLISRHGTRYPDAYFTSNKVPKVQEVHKEFVDKSEREWNSTGDCRLCNEDAALLKSWQWNENIKPSMDEYLHAQGWIDLFLVGRNYKKLIQKITPLKYNPKVFHFRHSDTQRTNASFKAFYTGLFGARANPLPPIPKPDLLLRPYDYCEAFDKRANKNETKLFEETPEFKDMIRNVSAKLGHTSNIQTEIIKSMWDLCRYEQSWQITKASPWCVLFTHKQNDVFEYFEDLKYFHKSGYAHPQNEFLMCDAMQDLLRNLQNDKSGAKVTAYFSHSTALMLMNVALDLHRDNLPLKADNYKKQANRMWSSSKLDPFATNIAVVKYACSDAVDKIRFYANEALLKPKWCDSNGICSLQKMLEKYSKFLDMNCTQTFCQ